MAIEIDNFRAKYPQYSDVSDIDLASMLANKYPDQYGDLPGKVQAEIQPEQMEPQGVDLEFPQHITGAAELGATLATGAIAEPISGIAGIAKAITSGPEAAAKSIEDIQQALTYAPRTEGGKELASRINRLLGPIIDFVGKVPQAAGDIAYEAGGPAAGTAAYSLVSMIPEVMGLKGTRAVRESALKTIMKDRDISEIYDEFGNIRPEIKNPIEDGGIDVKEVVPEAYEEQAEKIRKTRSGLPSEEIIADIDPQESVLKAAEEFGVSDNLLTSHYSGNPTFRAIEQGLKSIPGSNLALREKALISDVAKRADDLIEEFGGSLDKTAMSDEFRLRSERVIDDLERQADTAYTQLNEAIPKKEIVAATNTLNFLNGMIDELGGARYLSVPERRLLKTLDPESRPTYARLDKARREIGQALNKRSGPFKDSEAGLLKQLYKSLTEDQRAIADTHGMADGLDLAKDLVSTRKILEDQLVKSLGKDLTGNIASKAKPAMLNLSKGDTKQFDTLMNNIPEQLGPEMRKNVASTALNDAFVMGSRMEKSLNIPGFDDFMNGLKRNKGAYKKLEKELGVEQMKRLDNFHVLVKGIREAQKEAITTGRIVSVPKMFDESVGIASRVYGTARTILPEIITTIGGMPGLATAMRFSMPSARKTKRSVAADELLASNNFRNAVRSATKPDIDKKRIERRIKNIPAYKRWLKTLTESEAAELAAVGIVGYLTGEENKEIE